MKVIGGKRRIGTGRVHCIICGIQMKAGDVHVETDVISEVNGFPVSDKCPNSGKVSNAGFTRDDWNKDVYEWR